MTTRLAAVSCRRAVSEPPVSIRGALRDWEEAHVETNTSSAGADQEAEAVGVGVEGVDELHAFKRCRSGSSRRSSPTPLTLVTTGHRAIQGYLGSTNDQQSS